MDKKYQIFISSTYKDLIEERRKVQDTILSMNHFPVGMELFSADDDEQWDVIKRTIDTSDYYVLIIAHRYGSVIESGEDAGISYTEKEFRYALSKEIPVHVFLIDKNAQVRASDMEDDCKKKKKLDSFKAEAMSGRTVEWWLNKDDLANKVMNSLYKKFPGSTRPGWIRGDSIDVDKTLREMTSLSKRNRELEEENRRLLTEIQRYKEANSARQPKLTMHIYGAERDEESRTYGDLYHNVDCFCEDDEGRIMIIMHPVDTSQIEAEYLPVSKADFAGELRGHVSDLEIAEYNKALPDQEVLQTYIREYVRYMRIKESGIPVNIFILNDGNAKATDVSVELEFPEEILVLDIDDVEEINEPKKPPKLGNLHMLAYKRTHASEAAMERMYSQLGLLAEQAERRSFLPILRPGKINTIYESLTVSGNTVNIEWKNGIVHTKSDYMKGVYIVPLVEGKYRIKATIMCAEYKEPDIKYIEVVSKEE